MLKQTMEAAAAFGAPYNVVFWGVDEGATFTSCVERRGILSLGTELGGWGRVNVEGVRIGRRGIDNILKHFGVIEGEPDTPSATALRPASHMMVRDPGLYTFAPRGGLFEPCHTTGDTWRTGEAAGWLHFVEDIDRPPTELRYAQRRYHVDVRRSRPVSAWRRRGRRDEGLLNRRRSGSKLASRMKAPGR